MIKKYKKLMTKTYQDTYEDRYNLNPKLLSYYKKIFKKNLKEMKISIKDLKKKTVLNVGTGLESVVFHILGAKKVYHCDISSKAHRSVQKHKRKYNRLFSKQIDLSSKKLVLPENIDIIYLYGVFHHFNNPKFALQNLVNVLNPDGRIFIRNYTSGSMLFFIADYIRKFMPKDKQSLIKNKFIKKFGKFKLNHRNWNNNFITYLYSDLCIDHSCVPTLNLFNANKFQEYFELHNFENLNKKKYPSYFHKDYLNKNLVMQSFIFKNLNKKKVRLKRNFLISEDQLLIKYKENYIQNTVKLMKRNIRRFKKFNLNKKINLLIDLSYIGNVYRFHKLYKKVKDDFFKLNYKNLSNVKGIHYFLNERLNK